MVKKSKLTIVAMVMFVLSTLVIVSPKPARAFFLWDPYQTMVQEMLTIISQGMDTMMTTILTLSDDIGTMADRILVMSDNIGVMADRIVTTEELMADLVRDVTDSKGPSTLLTFPVEGAFVSLSSPFDISLSNGSENYTLFISNSADMLEATNVLVLAGDTTSATSRAADYATGTQLYLAVKAIDGDTMGPVSNTVMVNITQ